MGPLKHLALLAILATTVYAIPKDRKEKSIGIFNIVKFPNDVCQSSDANRLGTCYTAEECSTRNGVASGTCADGYGVCCVVMLTCGASTSDNCTHLSQAASNDPAKDPGSDTVCTYTICPASSTINRIRLDITTFDIAGPDAPTSTNGNAAGTAGRTTTLGHCLTDSLTVSGPSGPYPVICGVNNDQHMIVDTDGTACVTATFAYGMAMAMRSYEIHVIQYDALNKMGGPPRCLQFYTGLMGIVRTFNWQMAQTGTHLANQNYDVCVRPEAGRCVFCWSPTGMAGGGTTVGNFGISNGESTAGAAMSGAGAKCTGNDFIIIPNGANSMPATMIASGSGINRPVVTTGELAFPSRFCGRYLNVATGGAATDITVCTRSTSFRLGVRFDDTEAVAAPAAADQLAAQEASGTQAGGTTLTSPLGTAGFELGFSQIAC